MQQISKIIKLKDAKLYLGRSDGFGKQLLQELHLGRRHSGFSLGAFQLANVRPRCV